MPIIDVGKTLAPELLHVEGENIVLIYYLQTVQAQPSAPGVMMYSLQKVKSHPGSPNIQIDDSVFKPYILPTKSGK